jgi:hypothetical protein
VVAALPGAWHCRLIIRSRRPRRFAQRKVFEREEHLIRALRTQRRLGSNTKTGLKAYRGRPFALNEIE